MFLKSGNTLRSLNLKKVSKVKSKMEVVVIVFDEFERLQKLIKNIQAADNTCYFLTGHLSSVNKNKLVGLVKKSKVLDLVEAMSAGKLKGNAIYILPVDRLVSIVSGKFVFSKTSLKSKVISHADQMLECLAKKIKENLTVVYISEKRMDGYSSIQKIKKVNAHIFIQPPVSTKLKTISESFKGKNIVQFEVSSKKLGLKISNATSSKPIRSEKTTKEKAVKKKTKNNRISEDLGYKILLDHASIAFFITKPDGSILEANQAACELFGYSEKEFILLGRQGIIDSAAKNIDKVLSEREKKGFVIAKMIAIKKTGERFLIEASSRLIYNSNKEKISITSILDVSKQHRSEQEMKWLINSADESFVLLDLDLKIVSFNNKFSFLFDVLFDKKVKKGESVFEYTQPDRLDLVRKIYKNVLKGSVERDVISVKMPEGKIRMFSLKYSPARNDKDKIIGVFVSSLDVTEENELKLQQKKLLKELESRNSFIETILQNIPIGIAVNQVDNGKATLVNSRFHQIYGWEENDFSDIEDFFKKVYPDENYRNEIRSKVLSDIQSKDPNRMQWENIEVTTKSGEKRFVNAKNIPLFEHNLMISTVVDVTNEARQTAEITKIKDNQEALINGTLDLIWSADKELRLVNFNKAYSDRIFLASNRKPKEGDSVFVKEFGEELIVEWQGYYSRALDGEAFTIKNKTYIPARKKYVYGVISFNPMFNKEGIQFGVACYSKDITDDVLNLQALEKTQKKLSKIMDSSLDVICSVGKDGKFISLSQAANTVFDLPAEELVGTPLLDIISIEDSIQTQEILDAIRNGKTITNFENICITSEGNRVSLAWSVNWDEQDDIFYLVARDISLQKLNEQALHKSEINYKKLFESNPSPMFIWDLETYRIIDCNEEALTKYGYSREEFLMLTIKDLKLSEDRKIVEDLMDSGALNGSVHKILTRHVKKNGELMYMEISGHHIDFNGRRASLVVVNDITDKLIAEEQKEFEKRDKEALINGTDDFMWSLTTDYKLIAANKSFVQRMKDSSGIELKPGDDLMMRGSYDEQYLLFWANLYNRALGGESFKKELYWPAFSTFYETWIEYSFNPIYKEELVVGVACHSRNITERKLAEIQIEQNQLLLNETQRLTKTGNWKYEILEDRLTWSDSLYEVYGIEKSAFKGTHDSFLELVDEADRKFVDKSCTEAQITGEPFNVEYHITTFKGERKVIEEFGYIEKDASGKIIRLFGTDQDITERKQAEFKLRESNQRYEYITKATFDAIWDWDVKSSTVFLGDGYYQLFGEIPEQPAIEIQNILSRIHPDDFATVMSGAKLAIKRSDLNWNQDHRFRKADGSCAFVSNKAVLLRDSNGKVTRVIGAMQDITKRKADEFTLQQSEARHKGLIASQTNYIIRTDLNSNYSYVNNKYITEFSWIHKKSELIGIHSLESIMPYHHQRVQEVVENCFASMNSVFQVEIDKPGKNGGVKTTLWDFICLTDSDGNPSEIQCVGIDISARKIAERELKKSLNEKNTILESIGDGFFAVDKDWIVTYWNNQAEKMLNVKRSNIVGRKLWDVFPVKMESRTYIKYHQAVERKEILHFETYDKKIEKWFEIGAYPAEGGLSVYFKDINNRKLAEFKLKVLNENLQRHAKELAMSNAELEQFAYVASHDLQEPLRMVTSFLTQLEKKYGNVIDVKGKKYIELAVDGAKRMRQIILDLLEFSRIGRMESLEETIHLDDLIQEIQILYRNRIEERDAVINVGSLPVLNSYKTPLRQIFQNLISNALKYSKNEIQPVINISAKEFPQYWQFSVADNGIGIHSDYFEKIFIIFQRLHHKEEYSGTGMGLAVTKKIIDNLNGKIWVDAKEGVGSTFYFTLNKSVFK